MSPVVELFKDLTDADSVEDLEEVWPRSHFLSHRLLGVMSGI